MVLPLLLGLGLPALGATAASGTFLATMAGALGPVGMGALGTGLGSFIQTGDLGEGIQTGLTSFLGGKLLGGLTGGSGAGGENISTAYGGANSTTALAKPGFLQAAPSLTDTGGLFASQGMQQAAAGAFAPGVMPSAFIGSTMAGISADERAAKEAAKKREANKTQAPLPNPMRTTYNPTPYYDSPGEGSYFQYQRPPRPDGSQVEYPYTYASGGLMGLRRMQEGGIVSEEMNEKELIEEAVAAIKGESDNPKEILGMFLLKFGEEQLRSLVGRVQSGELDDTVARFEEGDKGMVRGPGDGSGVDDMVPATLEGEQDVLLSDGEFVLRKKTTDALEKAYGGGFLDVINRAEKDAPEKLQRMVG
jgi:hypothetical protein